MTNFKTPKQIDLKLPINGFREFISSWVYECDSKILVVDPGPANSLPILVKTLKDRQPDIILLTHIHIDHAGGTGDLCSLYPKAKIICLDKAKKHLIDPKQLIIGSREVAGDLMDVYGNIAPVSPDKFINAGDEINFLPSLEIISTPGHASHHISFLLNDYIFCGEALGVRYDLNDSLYLRPATPPPFKLDTYKESIKRLSTFKSKYLLFAHYGCINWSEEIFTLALNQIDLWVKVIKENKEFDKAIELLLREDEMFSNFRFLPKDIQEREMIFIKNTFNGIDNMKN